jgi:hypothetical protein
MSTRPITSTCNMRRLTLALLCMTAFMPFRQGGAAPPENLQLHEVVVHYVHLVGHADPNEIMRKTLLDEHGYCAKRKRMSGKPVTPLPVDGIPPIAHAMTTEIYYSVNRTLTNTSGEAYLIDPPTCKLVKNEYRSRRLVSGAGACQIDLIKRTARGQCDADEHRRASARPLPAISLAPPPEATLKIKNIPCEVFRGTINNRKTCMANPKSDFPIPAAYPHDNFPGLLLKMENDMETLEADKVVLHMRVSEDVFSVPPNLKIFSFPLPGR